MAARVYVALSSDMVAVINTSSNVASLAQIDAAPELGAHSLALGPSGAVYVTDGADRVLRSMSLVDGTVTIGRSALVLPNSNGYAVQATWYFPHHDDAPVGLIYLQHGAWRTDTHLSALAQQLADRTNSIVVTPTVRTNAFDRYDISGDPIERAVAALFVGDRSALTASAAAAAGHPVTLPQQVVLAGHSRGGNLVAAAAGYLADAGGTGNLKGVILFDAHHDGDAKTGMAKLKGAKAVPVMSISPPPCDCNNNGAETTTTINAAPDKFVGIMLIGGSHMDAEGASTDSVGIAGCGPAATPANAAAVQTITAAWINDVFHPEVLPTGIYAPAGTLIAVNGATARCLPSRGSTRARPPRDPVNIVDLINKVTVVSVETVELADQRLPLRKRRTGFRRALIQSCSKAGDLVQGCAVGSVWSASPPTSSSAPITSCGVSRKVSGCPSTTCRPARSTTALATPSKPT